ncbi:MAG: shikimate kinase [Chloroflexi bacterium]|nr:shikimate kinase [Chloroflexota bacterium]MBI3739692.1 shikimate kinase [Chloroflexota bacterium]
MTKDEGRRTKDDGRRTEDEGRMEMTNEKIIDSPQFSRHPSPVTRHPSLVLTGFMGTGKSSVGKIVARKLAREFVDMDAAMEAREGMSVSEIFAAKGEKYFRARETELCRELGARENLVIATGGGALVRVENRAYFADAVVICLEASVDEIVARLRGGDKRPLLANGALRERVLALLNERRDAYAQIKWRVDTNDKTVQDVAAQVIALYERVTNEKD